MAYTPLTIVTTKLEKTNFIPEFVNLINNNNDQLKSAIEALNNKLFINTSAVTDNPTSGGVIGDTVPLASISTNLAILKTANTGGNGISIQKLNGEEIGYIKNIDGKCIASFDNVIIKESATSYSINQYDAIVSGVIATVNIPLIETGSQEIIANIKLPIDAFNGSAFLVDEIKVNLLYDSILPALDGQNFSITFGKLIDSTNTEITIALPTTVITLSSSSGFVNKTGINLTLVDSGINFNSVSGYNKTVSIKCITLDAVKKILIKNIS